MDQDPDKSGEQPGEDESLAPDSGKTLGQILNRKTSRVWLGVIGVLLALMGFGMLYVYRTPVATDNSLTESVYGGISYFMYK